MNAQIGKIKRAVAIADENARVPNETNYADDRTRLETYIRDSCLYAGEEYQKSHRKMWWLP